MDYDYRIPDSADLKIRIKRLPAIARMIQRGQWVYIWFKKEPKQGRLI